ncbi:MAG TPA: tetratricopeptide repeat protein [Methylocella sp.]|nr:tetratricopeptide repeat protein [Methylocella sp.]
MPFKMMGCAAIFLVTALCTGAAGAPFIPQSDAEVLERLPFKASDPAMRQLRALRDQLTAEPENLAAAARLAQGYLEAGRATSDPRYTGYAQAALAPWWSLPNPPEEILVLRAAIRQRSHQFGAALADLAAALEANPRNAEALLMRATIFLVTGDFEHAKAGCAALRPLTQELTWVACFAQVNGATGELRKSYESLRAALDRSHGATPRMRAWVLTSLAEMAARLGFAQEADSHFQEALAASGADSYLLGAYAGFLLDEGRPKEAVALLGSHLRADPLLLRYALGLRAIQSSGLNARIEELRGRFDASRLRGERLHLRDEALFTLLLLNDPAAALELARENWRIQKEPADLRILLEAAIASRNEAEIEAVKNWVKKTGFEDARLNRIISAPLQPN